MFKINQRIKWVGLFMSSCLLFSVAAAACGGTETIEVEKIVTKEVPVEVEKIVEKQVEVIVEKVVEKEVEVVVEKVITVTKQEGAPASGGGPTGTLSIALSGVGVPVGDPQGCVPGCGNQKFRMSAYETLGWLDGDANMIPRIATSWDVKDDYVDFTIKEGVEFHNGYGEMTAEDVAWSFNRANPVTNPDSKHDQAGDFKRIMDKMEAIDSSTVRMTIPEGGLGVGQLRRALTPYWQSMGIHSKKVFDELGAEGMVDNFTGTGPLVFKEWKQDDKAVLEALDSHWRKTAPMQTVRVLAVPEATVRRTMLETGEVDVAQIDLKDIPAVLDKGFESFVTASRLNGLYFGGNLWVENQIIIGKGNTGDPLERPGYNTANPNPWVGIYGDDASMEKAKNVRHALGMAIDRAGINDAILGGLGSVNHITNIPINSKFWDSKWEWPYDVAKAKELMAEAGYSDGFEMTIWTGAGTHEEIVGAIGATWLSELKVKVSIDLQTYSTHRPRLVNLEYDQIQYRTCGDSFAALTVDLPKSNESTSDKLGGTICAGSMIPEWEAIYEKMVTETDKAKREAMGLEFFDVTRDNAIAIGVNEQPALNVFDGSKIGNWPIPPQMCIGGCEWFNLEEIEWK